jgi:hypothetical protein
VKIDQFRRLGDDIRAELSKTHWDEKALPDIAAVALERTDLEFDFELGPLSDFLITTTIKQQPDNAFSNLPLVVYKCEDFYIELLVWTNSTTAIHQHAFSGAFRVMVGSSFHSVWNFDERERLSSRLLIGECGFEHAEVLRVGDVRRISSGRDGLLHALFHLEQPSITLVVRNNESWASPQYALDPPHIAYAAHELNLDATVRLLSRLLGVAAQLELEKPADLLTSWCARLDFPRLYEMVRRNYDMVSTKDHWDRFMCAAEQSHGEHAEHLETLIQSSKRKSSIIASRNSIKDSDLRFFLALLLNTPSRDWMLRLIRDRYPDQRAEEFCLRSLKQLREAESLTAAFYELASKAKLGQDRLGARLGAAIEYKTDDPRTDEVLRTLIAGAAAESAGHISKMPKSNDDAARTRAVLGKLQGLSELAPFFA